MTLAPNPSPTFFCSLVWALRRAAAVLAYQAVHFFVVDAIPRFIAQMVWDHQIRVVHKFQSKEGFYISNHHIVLHPFTVVPERMAAFDGTFALMLIQWSGLAKPGAFRHPACTDRPCYAEAFADIRARDHSPFFRWDYFFFRNPFLILISSFFSVTNSFSF